MTNNSNIYPNSQRFINAECKDILSVQKKKGIRYILNFTKLEWHMNF